jgi:hypothetical protein
MMRPLARFLHIEAGSGLVLVACTVVALVAANSLWAESYLAIWKTPITLGFGNYVFQHSLHHVINDGLMAIFFFVIGLELHFRRKVIAYELMLPRKRPSENMEVTTPTHVSKGQGWLSVNAPVDHRKLNIPANLHPPSTTSGEGSPRRIRIAGEPRRLAFPSPVPSHPWSLR